MHFPRKGQLAPGASDPPSAVEITSPNFSSRQPYQPASYRILDQERFDIGRNIPTNFQHALLPCPQLPVSTSPTRAWQSSSTLVVERRNSSGSLSSVGSIRRSVPGMKNLMPLRLQSPRQRSKADLSSWLKTTASTSPLLPPIVFEAKPESPQEAIDESKIPWMWSQGGSLLQDLNPNKYRETPIYSEPRSPMLCRAYFSEEDLCYNCPPPGSTCDELCIVSDYEEEDSTDSQSQASFADCAETFDRDMDDSMETSRTSVTSSRLSRLSIQCQGELSLMNDNKSSILSPTSQYESRFEDFEAPTTVEEPPDGHFNHWLDADSSRSSSPDSLDSGVFSACATPLAPARATMVVVPKSPTAADEFSFQEALYYPPRPSTPFRVRNRRKSFMDDSLSISTALKKYGNQTHRPQDRALRSRPSLPHVDFDVAMYSPSPTPYEPIRRPSINSSIDMPRPPSPVEPDKPSSTDSVISAICATLTTFPRTMLFLDTPCILSIRRLNTAHNGFRLSQLSLFPAPPSSDPPLICSPPDLRPRRYRLRKSKGASLFGSKSLRRQKSQRQQDNSDIAHTSTVTDRPTTARSALFTSEIDLISPNLRPLRAIFPHTDDWWRGVLYAHLVAYNYVRTPISVSSPSGPDASPNTSSSTSTSTSAPQHANPGSAAEISVSTARTEIPNHFNTSPKASRTLGLVLPTLPYLSGRESRLEVAREVLEECVGRIAECMMCEDGMAGVGLAGSAGGSKIDPGFVRALAEVVRGCEGLS